MIRDKSLCSGCTACQSICPKSCISMRADKMGSVYPDVNESLCIECGACVRVCPFLNPQPVAEAIESFSAVNRADDIRLCSSSGGVFYALGSEVINRGGQVVGAVFNKDWTVSHTFAENLADLAKMRGSKYVQSDLSEIFAKVKKKLKAGVEILFTGTPCQIAGLTHFLKRDYPNLLKVEIICHGVPERGVWQAYLTETRKLNDNKDIIAIKFRDKTMGWQNYGVAKLWSGDSLYKIEHHKDNAYMKAFLYDYSLRPSCYSCKAKSGKSGADLTIGDFWKADKTEVEDDKGQSCVICHTARGLKAIVECDSLVLHKAEYNEIFAGNPALESSVVFTENARYFHAHFPKRGFYKTLKGIFYPSVLRILKNKLSKLI